MSLTRKQLKAITFVMCLKALEDLENEENRRKTPDFWVNPFIMKRELHNVEVNLLKDLNWGDGDDYKNFVRMSVHDFEEILSLIENDIKKKDTQMRYAVSARLRLAITIRFLASGDSFRSLEFLSRVSRKTISKFIPEVLKSIYEALQPEYMKVPRTEEERNQVVDDFEAIWNFPHTLGAIDGKHIRIKKPSNTGSDFFNYKHYFSMVLLALVDAHCKFIYINVGANGKSSDSTIFKESKFYSDLNNDSLNIPPPKELKGQQEKIPYYVVGDDAFGLGRNIMKPFNRNLKLTIPQQAFNYRLGRARMTVEMSFGRLASRFRIFHRPIELKEETTEILIKTCCVLHNFLTKCRVSPAQGNHINQTNIEFPTSMRSLAYQQVNNYKFSSRIRDNVAQYCVSEGNVSFQWKKLNLTN